MPLAIIFLWWWLMIEVHAAWTDDNKYAAWVGMVIVCRWPWNHDVVAIMTLVLGHLDVLFNIFELG